MLGKSDGRVVVALLETYPRRAVPLTANGSLIVDVPTRVSSQVAGAHFLLTMTSSFGAKFARRLMVFWGIFAAVTGFLCRELRRHEFMLEVRNNGSATANFGATGWSLTTPRYYFWTIL